MYKYTSVGLQHQVKVNIHPLFTALHIADPSTEWKKRSVQVHVFVCTHVYAHLWVSARKVSLSGYQTRLVSMFEWKSRWGGFPVVRKQNSSDTLTLVGVSGTNKRGKRDNVICGDIPKSHIVPSWGQQSHRALFCYIFLHSKIAQ